MLAFLFLVVNYLEGPPFSYCRQLHGRATFYSLLTLDIWKGYSFSSLLSTSWRGHLFSYGRQLPERGGCALIDVSYQECQLLFLLLSPTRNGSLSLMDVGYLEGLAFLFFDVSYLEDLLFSSLPSTIWRGCLFSYWRQLPRSWLFSSLPLTTWRGCLFSYWRNLPGKAGLSLHCRQLPGGTIFSTTWKGWLCSYWCQLPGFLFIVVTY